jgi:hypothetical protein
VAIARPARGSEPFVEIISAPGVVAGFLARPGDCAVVRAEQGCQVSIRLTSGDDAAVPEVSFTLEPLSGLSGAQVERVDAVTAPTQPTDAAASKFRLRGHLSRRGDVEAEAGVWVGGPSAPAAIEGLEIVGPLPNGVSVEFQPLVATRPQRWLDWAPQGVFAGTRGRALSLSGLRIRLTGFAAERFTLAADALFLGSPVISKRGREIELVSSAGADPLVGLRLDILSEPAALEAADATSHFASGTRAESRVRVFRAAVSQ